MAWRVAKSLDTLLGEINRTAPRREKHSDGSIGDSDHRNRGSDHNPWVPPPRGGVVTARDITHDPQGGLDCSKLAEHLRRRGAGGDRRVKYVIFNRRIVSASNDWKWRAYTGENPHVKHLHISVAPALSLADSTKPWGWAATAATPLPSKPDTDDDPWGSFNTGRVGARTVRLWSCGKDVEALQGFIGDVADDGYFGKATEAQVKEYQRMRGLVADGIVGPRTWGPILKVLGV